MASKRLQNHKKYLRETLAQASHEILENFHAEWAEVRERHPGRIRVDHNQRTHRIELEQFDSEEKTHEYISGVIFIEPHMLPGLLRQLQAKHEFIQATAPKLLRKKKKHGKGRA